MYLDNGLFNTPFLLLIIANSRKLIRKVILENIHTYPKDGHWKFRWEGESQKPTFLGKVWSKTGNSRGREGPNQNTILGGDGYFLEPYNEKWTYTNEDLRAVKSYSFVKKYHLLTTVYGN